MLYLGSDRVKNWFFLFQFGGCSHRHHHQASHHLQVTQIYYYLLIFIIIYYQDCGPEWQGVRPRHPGEVAAGPAEPRTDWQGGAEESRGGHWGTGQQAGQDFITTWHQQAWQAQAFNVIYNMRNSLRNFMVLFICKYGWRKRINILCLTCCLYLTFYFIFINFPFLVRVSC